MRPHPYRWEFSLVGICAIWGVTFVVVQDAVERVPPFAFLALRFAIATVVLAGARGFRGIRRDEMRAGAAMGIALFGGYAFQTVGLQYTSSSKAGFLTGLFVVITPLLGAIVLRRLPSATTALGVALATAGLALMSLRDELRLTRGDVLLLFCALSFAVHILLIGRLSGNRSALRLASVQVAVAATLSAIWSITGEHTIPHLDGGVVGAVLVTGVFATALAFAVQVRAQQFIPPTRAAVIFTAEPVFAGVFGFWVAGDRLGGRGYAGAALILAGIVAVEVLSPAREDV